MVSKALAETFIESEFKMEIEDWIICETLHTVDDLNVFIENYNGECCLLLIIGLYIFE